MKDEASRMTWATDLLTVPKVISAGSDRQVGWLVTQALPGRDATDASLIEDPEALVRILAKGLRLFKNSGPGGEGHTLLASDSRHRFEP